MDPFKRIGIAISTRNRREAFDRCYESMVKYLPDNSELVIVDDASDAPCKNSTYRFEKRMGIPAVKNKCIELLYDLGCYYFFLFDDDTYPIANDWHFPYINSGKEHLCYTFLQKCKVKDGFTYHKLGNGACMFFTKKVVDTIGGFDWRFGLGKYEHVNFSRRIHNAGLTEAVFMDVVGSDKLLYCMDQKREVQRSFTPKEMSVLLNNGAKHHRNSLKSKEYISYELQSTEH